MTRVFKKTLLYDAKLILQLNQLTANVAKYRRTFHLSGSADAPDKIANANCLLRTHS